GFELDWAMPRPPASSRDFLANPDRRPLCAECAAARHLVLECPVRWSTDARSPVRCTGLRVESDVLFAFRPRALAYRVRSPP
ncbi:MAG: hypothetical protein ACRD0P_30480, partial [Stackebrandtia sp.]